MNYIAIYGKSISEINLKFLNRLITSLVEELDAKIFIHKGLKNYNIFQKS